MDTTVAVSATGDATSLPTGVVPSPGRADGNSSETFDSDDDVDLTADGGAGSDAATGGLGAEAAAAASSLIPIEVEDDDAEEADGSDALADAGMRADDAAGVVPSDAHQPSSVSGVKRPRPDHAAAVREDAAVGVSHAPAAAAAAVPASPAAGFGRLPASLTQHMPSQQWIGDGSHPHTGRRVREQATALPADDDAAGPPAKRPRTTEGGVERDASHGDHGEPVVASAAAAAAAAAVATSADRLSARFDADNPNRLLPAVDRRWETSKRERRQRKQRMHDLQSRPAAAFAAVPASSHYEAYSTSIGAAVETGDVHALMEQWRGLADLRRYAAMPEAEQAFPLHRALHRGHLLVFAFLVAAGLDPLQRGSTFPFDGDTLAAPPAADGEADDKPLVYRVTCVSLWRTLTKRGLDRSKFTPLLELWDRRSTAFEPDAQRARRRTRRRAIELLRRVDRMGTDASKMRGGGRLFRQQLAWLGDNVQVGGSSTLSPAQWMAHIQRLPSHDANGDHYWKDKNRGAYPPLNEDAPDPLQLLSFGPDEVRDDHLDGLPTSAAVVGGAGASAADPSEGLEGDAAASALGRDVAVADVSTGWQRPTRAARHALASAGAADASTSGRAGSRSAASYIAQQHAQEASEEWDALVAEVKLRYWKNRNMAKPPSAAADNIFEVVAAIRPLLADARHLDAADDPWHSVAHRVGKEECIPATDDGLEIAVECIAFVCDKEDAAAADGVAGAASSAAAGTGGSDAVTIDGGPVVDDAAGTDGAASAANRIVALASRVRASPTWVTFVDAARGPRQLLLHAAHYLRPGLVKLLLLLGFQRDAPGSAVSYTGDNIRTYDYNMQHITPLQVVAAMGALLDGKFRADRLREVRTLLEDDALQHPLDFALSRLEAAKAAEADSDASSTSTGSATSSRRSPVRAAVASRSHDAMQHAEPARVPGPVPKRRRRGSPATSTAGAAAGDHRRTRTRLPRVPRASDDDGRSASTDASSSPASSSSAYTSPAPTSSDDDDVAVPRPLFNAALARKERQVAHMYSEAPALPDTDDAASVRNGSLPVAARSKRQHKHGERKGERTKRVGDSTSRKALRKGEQSRGGSHRSRHASVPSAGAGRHGMDASMRDLHRLMSSDDDSDDDGAPAAAASSRPADDDDDDVVIGPRGARPATASGVDHHHRTSRPLSDVAAAALGRGTVAALVRPRASGVPRLTAVVSVSQRMGRGKRSSDERRQLAAGIERAGNATKTDADAARESILRSNLERLRRTWDSIRHHTSAHEPAVLTALDAASHADNESIYSAAVSNVPPNPAAATKDRKTLAQALGFDPILLMAALQHRSLYDEQGALRPEHAAAAASAAAPAFPAVAEPMPAPVVTDFDRLQVQIERLRILRNEQLQLVYMRTLAERIAASRSHQTAVSASAVRRVQPPLSLGQVALQHARARLKDLPLLDATGRGRGGRWAAAGALSTASQARMIGGHGHVPNVRPIDGRGGGARPHGAARHAPAGVESLPGLPQLQGVGRSTAPPDPAATALTTYVAPRHAPSGRDAAAMGAVAPSGRAPAPFLESTPLLTSSVPASSSAVLVVESAPSSTAEPAVLSLATTVPVDAATMMICPPSASNAAGAPAGAVDVLDVDAPVIPTFSAGQRDPSTCNVTIFPQVTEQELTTVPRKYPPEPWGVRDGYFVRPPASTLPARPVAEFHLLAPSGSSRSPAATPAPPGELRGTGAPAGSIADADADDVAASAPLQLLPVDADFDDEIEKLILQLSAGPECVETLNLIGWYVAGQGAVVESAEIRRVATENRLAPMALADAVTETSPVVKVWQALRRTSRALLAVGDTLARSYGELTVDQSADMSAAVLQLGVGLLTTPLGDSSWTSAAPGILSEAHVRIPVVVALASMADLESAESTARCGTLRYYATLHWNVCSWVSVMLQQSSGRRLPVSVLDLAATAVRVVTVQLLQILVDFPSAFELPAAASLSRIGRPGGARGSAAGAPRVDVDTPVLVALMQAQHAWHLLRKASQGGLGTSSGKPRAKLLPYVDEAKRLLTSRSSATSWRSCFRIGDASGGRFRLPWGPAHVEEVMAEWRDLCVTAAAFDCVPVSSGSAIDDDGSDAPVVAVAAVYEHAQAPLPPVSTLAGQTRRQVIDAMASASCPYSAREAMAAHARRCHYTVPTSPRDVDGRRERLSVTRVSADFVSTLRCCEELRGERVRGFVLRTAHAAPAADAPLAIDDATRFKIASRFVRLQFLRVLAHLAAGAASTGSDDELLPAVASSVGPVLRACGEVLLKDAASSCGTATEAGFGAATRSNVSMQDLWLQAAGASDIASDDVDTPLRNDELPPWLLRLVASKALQGGHAAGSATSLPQPSAAPVGAAAGGRLVLASIEYLLHSIDVDASDGMVTACQHLIRMQHDVAALAVLAFDATRGAHAKKHVGSTLAGQLARVVTAERHGDGLQGRLFVALAAMAMHENRHDIITAILDERQAAVFAKMAASDRSLAVQGATVALLVAVRAAAADPKHGHDAATVATFLRAVNNALVGATTSVSAAAAARSRHQHARQLAELEQLIDAEAGSVVACTDAAWCALQECKRDSSLWRTVVASDSMSGAGAAPAQAELMVGDLLLDIVGRLVRAATAAYGARQSAVAAKHTFSSITLLHALDAAVALVAEAVAVAAPVGGLAAARVAVTAAASASSAGAASATLDNVVASSNATQASLALCDRACDLLGALATAAAQLMARALAGDELAAIEAGDALEALVPEAAPAVSPPLALLSAASGASQPAEPTTVQTALHLARDLSAEWSSGLASCVAAAATIGPAAIGERLQALVAALKLKPAAAAANALPEQHDALAPVLLWSTLARVAVALADGPEKVWHGSLLASHRAAAGIPMHSPAQYSHRALRSAFMARAADDGFLESLVLAWAQASRAVTGRRPAAGSMLAFALAWLLEHALPKEAPSAAAPASMKALLRGWVASCTTSNAPLSLHSLAAVCAPLVAASLPAAGASIPPGSSPFLARVRLLHLLATVEPADGGSGATADAAE